MKHVVCFGVLSIVSIGSAAASDDPPPCSFDSQISAVLPPDGAEDVPLDADVLVVEGIPCSLDGGPWRVTVTDASGELVLDEDVSTWGQNLVQADLGELHAGARYDVLTTGSQHEWTGAHEWSGSFVTGDAFASPPTVAPVADKVTFTATDEGDALWELRFGLSGDWRNQLSSEQAALTVVLLYIEDLEQPIAAGALTEEMMYVGGYRLATSVEDSRCVRLAFMDVAGNIGPYSEWYCDTPTVLGRRCGCRAAGVGGGSLAPLLALLALVRRRHR